jgi:hypothetical protein
MKYDDRTTQKPDLNLLNGVEVSKCSWTKIWKGRTFESWLIFDKSET